MSTWYQGKVLEYDKLTGKHIVRFHDGETTEYDLQHEALVWLDVSQLSSEAALKRMRSDEGDPIAIIRCVMFDTQKPSIGGHNLPFLCLSCRRESLIFSQSMTMIATSSSHGIQIQLRDSQQAASKCRHSSGLWLTVCVGMMKIKHQWKRSMGQTRLPFLSQSQPWARRSKRKLPIKKRLQTRFVAKLCHDKKRKRNLLELASVVIEEWQRQGTRDEQIRESPILEGAYQVCQYPSY